MQLARYVLRPPIAQDRLTRTADGRVLLTLKTEWSDGTTALPFAPVELLERLAALTPRPRINLVLHHGVLAPHGRWRGSGGRLRAGHTRPSRSRLCGPVRHGSSARPAERAVVCRRAGGERRIATRPRPDDRRRPRRASVYGAGESRPGRHRERGGAPPPAARKWSWPELMRHTFGVDVLACARCGNRMRVVATIEDPVVIRRILTHLGLPTEVSAPRPPPADLFDWS